MPRLIGAGPCGALVAAACLADPATAHPDHGDPRGDLLVALVAQAGCEMSERVADEVLPKYGYTRDEARAVILGLLAEGRVRVDRGSGRVTLAPQECF